MYQFDRQSTRCTGVESIFSRAFNSFGFIALLVCVAVLLTTISFSNAGESRDPTGDLLLLQSQGALIADVQAAQSGYIPLYPGED
jgi:hypothetical protein